MLQAQNIDVIGKNLDCKPHVVKKIGVVIPIPRGSKSGRESERKGMESEKEGKEKNLKERGRVKEVIRM